MKLKQAENRIIYGKIEVGGFLDDKKHDCGMKRIYNNYYDSDFCIKCNKWLEEKCPNKKCCFCHDRPKKPLEKGSRVIIKNIPLKERKSMYYK